MYSKEAGKLKDVDLKSINLNFFFNNDKSQDEDIEYSNLPDDLRSHFNWIYILSIFIVSISIVLGIVSKNIYFFIIFAFLGLTIALINTYHVMQTLNGKVICLEGECIEVNYAKGVKKWISYQRSFLTIQVFDDNSTSDDRPSIYIVAVIPNKTFWRSYKEKNIVRIYVPENAFFKTNDDTYKINSSYYMYCIKSNTSKEKQKQSKE